MGIKIGRSDQSEPRGSFRGIIEDQSVLLLALGPSWLREGPGLEPDIRVHCCGCLSRMVGVPVATWMHSYPEHCVRRRMESAWNQLLYHPDSSAWMVFPRKGMQTAVCRMKLHSEPQATGCSVLCGRNDNRLLIYMYR